MRLRMNTTRFARTIHQIDCTISQMIRGGVSRAVSRDIVKSIIELINI